MCISLKKSTFAIDLDTNRIHVAGVSWTTPRWQEIKSQGPFERKVKGSSINQINAFAASVSNETECLFEVQWAPCRRWTDQN